jgi:ABC-type oligopeptide transport system substrate-binding subunit
MNLGIELKHISASPTDFEKQDFFGVHMSQMGWSADYPDPDNFLRQSSFVLLISKAGWKNDHFANLVGEAAHSDNRARRMALYREADRMLVNELALFVPTMHNIRLFQDMVHPSIRSLAVDALGNMHYKHLNPGP